MSDKDYVAVLERMAQGNNIHGGAEDYKAFEAGAAALRRLKFLTTVGDEADGWCEHERRFTENRTDYESGDSYDHCVYCETEELKAGLDALKRGGK